jgi:hypothetical protein
MLPVMVSTSVPRDVPWNWSIGALGRSNGKRKGKFKRAKRLLPQRGGRAPSSLQSTDRELTVRWQSPIGA